MPAGWMTTELALENWREGSVDAERLTADVLNLDGFVDIMPQAPLGGADGGKDVLCAKGGKSYVAAAFFATTRKTIGAITKKFKSDLESSKKHNRDGFVFITNQKLTETQSTKLAELALKEGKECSILDRERIRVRLDSPEGYGVRTQYLGIPMTPEEQISFFSDESRRVMRFIERSSAELQRLSSKIELVLQGQETVKHTFEVLTRSASLSKLPAGGSLSAEPLVEKLSQHITPALIIAMHRLACGDLPSRMVGRFRDVAVMIASRGATSSADIVPPPAGKVHELVAKLCQEWNGAFAAMMKAGREKQLEAVARFHARLLHIHPFLDGNGRAGRAVLTQQCIDIFGGADISLFETGAAYAIALSKADKGDFVPLEDLIRPILPPAHRKRPK